MAHRLPPNPIQFVHVSDDLVFKEINTACNARRLRQLSAFVGAALGGTATYIKNMEGCYNLVLQFCVVREADTTDAGTASEEQHAVLRLPMPGFRAAALMAEMLQNEVTWLRYFAAHAIAKVPAVYAWSASADNTDVGHPYILMQYVAGEALSECLTCWAQSEDPADQVRTRAAFEDIAAMYLAMYNHRFDKIGVVSDSADGRWEDCAPYLNASDTGPFRLFNRDMHCRNMIVDPETGRLAAIIDLEGTAALPAAFAHDPPLYLLMANLDGLLSKGHLKLWQDKYTPILDVFLAIMQHLEAQQPPPPPPEAGTDGEAPLSAKMRASWESKQWLLHYAMHDIEVADLIFWSQEHYQMNCIPHVAEEALEPAMQAYEEHTKKQIESYEQDRIARRRR